MTWASSLTLAAFALYGIATTHDYLSMSRARLAAATELTAPGVPRTQILAGVEYDGWTQIEQAGYFNDPRIANPPGAYHPREDPIPPLGPHTYSANPEPSITSLLRGPLTAATVGEHAFPTSQLYVMAAAISSPRINSADTLTGTMPCPVSAEETREY